jgi:DNA (cytosine-5)-methyltransferase 1
VKPRLLDLFCKAGGAGKGYHDAGFEVVGVDIEPQPNYPFEFHQADALAVLRVLVTGVWHWNNYWLEDFDAIHASPPCQAHTSMQSMPNAKEHPDLVGPTRNWLERSNVPYVIENVVGAPLRSPITLCGAAFGLGSGEYVLARHRLFECSFPALTAGCAHRGRKVIGLYGDHARTNRRSRSRNDGQLGAADGLRMGGEAMGIDWMTWKELAQAIPPAYTGHIAQFLLAALEREKARHAA